MAIDFGESNFYMNNYLHDCDGDGTDDEDDEARPLLKLDVDCLYYDIDDMVKLVIPGLYQDSYIHIYTTYIQQSI